MGFIAALNWLDLIIWGDTPFLTVISYYIKLIFLASLVVSAVFSMCGACPPGVSYVCICKGCCSNTELTPSILSDAADGCVCDV